MDLYLRAVFRSYSACTTSKAQDADSLDSIYVGKLEHEQLPLSPDSVGQAGIKEAVVTRVEIIAPRIARPRVSESRCKFYGGHAIHVSSAWWPARSGQPVPQIRRFARRGAPVVMRYDIETSVVES